jgi:hypothetical protein
MHSASAFAVIIAQKRHTVEWFGKLLLRYGRECPAAMDIRSDVAVNYPERSDDLSGYLQAVLTSGESDRRAILPLLPLLTQNDALLEPVIRVPAISGMSWSDIQRGCQSKKPDFDLALMCLIASDAAQPPLRIERICSVRIRGRRLIQR